ncbi:MAG: hypothetical protein JRD89_18825 [Deltaproteobacteria bacterium]|nr:hypothetical protein [Deltaproteobacteria bacterium]
MKRYQVILSHVGTKRGGWNVQWYLETYEPGLDKPLMEKINLLPVREALENFGFKYSLYRPYLGPFSSKEEALRKAEELGLDVISRAKWGRIRKGKVEGGK